MNTQAAKKAAEFARIINYDRHGRASYVEVPGHAGKRYYVKLLRSNGRLYSHCWVDRAGFGNTHCPSSQICYHTLAAVMITAKEAGYTVIWCSDKQAAVRLANLGGSVFSVTNQLGNKAYGVVKDLHGK